MKNWRWMLVGLLAMGLMTGCKDPAEEEHGENKPASEETEAVVYMTVNVSLPKANYSKAGNSNITGSEVGQDYENTVSNLMIVLAKSEDNSFITYGTVTNPSLSGDNAQLYRAVASVNRDGLNQYYNSTDGGAPSGKVNVYVFCNYTDELLEMVTNYAKDAAARAGTAVWLNAFGDIGASGTDGGGLWRRGGFLMSNVSVEQRQIPTTLEVWLRYYAADPLQSFNLSGNNILDGINNGADGSGQGGSIRVQRAMARIDFKDASPKGDLVYTLQVTKGIGSGDLTVKLCRIALLNMSRKYYYLKRVSDVTKDQSTPAALVQNAIVCGLEIGLEEGGASNYVLDADATAAYKLCNTQNQHVDAGTTSQNYRHYLFNASGAITDGSRQGWQNIVIADLLSQGTQVGDYRIWTYTTENTIPHTDQRVGVATGVVFKGKLGYTDNTNPGLKAAIDGTYDEWVAENDSKKLDDKYVVSIEYNNQTYIFPILYGFGDPERRIYVGWNDQVKQMMTQNAALAEAANTKNMEINGQMYSPDELYQILVQNQDNPNRTEDDLANFKKSAVKAGFTLYQVSDDSKSGMASDTEGSVEAKDEFPLGYYSYFYYWNRHNTDGINGTMQPMEYATVRNNIYKISVKNINRFGHPRITENDPDPLTPDTPCEKDDLYMSVDIDVADWVVRENEIEF